SMLRRVLNQDRGQHSCIQTVPGRGYRFVAPGARDSPPVNPISCPISYGAFGLDKNWRGRAPHARPSRGTAQGGRPGPVSPPTNISLSVSLLHALYTTPLPHPALPNPPLAALTCSPPQ